MMICGMDVLVFVIVGVVSQESGNSISLEDSSIKHPERKKRQLRRNNGNFMEKV